MIPTDFCVQMSKDKNKQNEKGGILLVQQKKCFCADERRQNHRSGSVCLWLCSEVSVNLNNDSFYNFLHHSNLLQCARTLTFI